MKIYLVFYTSEKFGEKKLKHSRDSYSISLEEFFALNGSQQFDINFNESLSF